MRNYIRVLQFFTFSVACIFYNGSGHAKSQSQEHQRIKIDNKEFNKEEIINDFLNVAFSDITWNTDAGEESRKKIYEAFVSGNSNTYVNDSRLKEINSKPVSSVWLKKHIHYLGKGSLFKRNLINKWENKTISIGFGLPYSTRINEAKDDPEMIKMAKTSFEHSMREEGGDEKVNKIFAAIDKVVPVLSEAMNKPIELVHPRHVWDSTSEFARIRIILTNRPSFRSWLSVGHEPIPDKYEERFLNGVLFQSYTRRYFDGYILPNDNHGIDLAICKINPDLDSVFFNALLNECLLRVLGLPAISENKESVLSHWHSDPDHLLNYSPWYKIADRYADPAGEKQRLEHADLLAKQDVTYNDSSKKVDAEKIKKEYYHGKRVPLNENQLKSFNKITAYDRFMLSLLYCSEIEVGMNRESVRKILNNSNTCFE